MDGNQTACSVNIEAGISILVESAGLLTSMENKVRIKDLFVEAGKEHFLTRKINLIYLENPWTCSCI